MSADKFWDDDDPQSVRGGLRTLLEDEPPFGTPTAPAVDDAVRRGRRRRIGRTVLSGAGVMVAAAAATIAVVQLRPAVVESPAFQPAAPPAAVTPKPTPSPDTTSAPSELSAGLPGYDDLVPLVDAIAALAGESGDVTVLRREDMGESTDGREFEPYAAEARVILDGGGTLRVSVSAQPVEDGEGALDPYDEGCELGAGDGKPCDELLRTDIDGAWAPHGPQPGRELLWYAAVAPYGRLGVIIDNYTEQAGGDKVMGPSWTEAGFTVDAIDEAVAGSGLLDEG